VCARAQTRWLLQLVVHDGWTEAHAGGDHLSVGWHLNPQFTISAVVSAGRGGAGNGLLVRLDRSPLDARSVAQGAPTLPPARVCMHDESQPSNCCDEGPLAREHGMARFRRIGAACGPWLRGMV
jgi:hypothetical protein